MVNDNTTSEFEEKKWLISRLELITNTAFDDFKLTKSETDDLHKQLISSIIIKRNYVLSSVIFVSILLGTLHEIQLIITEHFLLLLFFDISAGLAVFVIVTIYIKSIDSVFVSLLNSATNAQMTLNRNFRFLIGKTSELTNITIEELKQYLQFLYVLTGIVYMPFRESLKICTKSRVLSSYYKNYFGDAAKGLESDLEKAISDFDKMNTIHIPTQMLQYVNDTIEIYKKNQSNSKNEK